MKPDPIRLAEERWQEIITDPEIQGLSRADWIIFCEEIASMSESSAKASREDDQREQEQP